MESSMIVLIVVVETLDFTGSIEPQQARNSMVVLPTICRAWIHYYPTPQGLG